VAAVCTLAVAIVANTAMFSVVDKVLPRPFRSTGRTASRDLMQLFRMLNEQGTTILQVTHSETNAACGSRIIRLREALERDHAHVEPIDVHDLELHRTGATICMVTHDARYASHAKRTIHLFDGRVVEESVAPL
jgi:ABC-type lipoprotein export system ATPase subunit